jgi:glycosyltransferase involved in cell wall biosynthesis
LNYKALKTNSNRGFFSKIQTLFSPILLARHTNKIQPDIIVSIAPGMNILLLLSSFLFNFKRPYLIIEEHQHLSTSLKMDKGSHTFLMWLFYKYFIKLYNKANCLKVVSESSKNDFEQKWGIIKSNIKVINPPINFQRLIENSKQNIPKFIKQFVNGEDYIFSLGRIENQKGFDLLINSFIDCKYFFPRLKLIICGDGSLKTEFNKLIKEKNLEKNVLFTGYLENPYPLFNRAKAFCLTSIWEGMPVTIMESMALKCPVISVDCPSGPSEMIKNFKTGLLVNRNKEDLTRAIKYVLENPFAANNWTKEAYKDAKAWSVDNYINSFKSIIDTYG